MRYIYIICLTLSSLFAYKYATAAGEAERYAFFMPNNAFEQNTSVQNIDNMSPRYNKPRYQADSVQNTRTVKNIGTAKNTRAVKTTATKNISSEPKVTLPYVKKEIQITPPEKTKPVTQNQPVVKKPTTPKKAPVLTEDVQKKLQQYSLDSFESTPETTAPVVTADSVKKAAAKNINQMLAEIPYPDRSQPKFKQLYSVYGTELRVLNRRGELPRNKEQEDTLAKANSFRRFTVE